LLAWRPASDREGELAEDRREPAAGFDVKCVCSAGARCRGRYQVFLDVLGRVTALVKLEPAEIYEATITV
jgi:hypothetical protein